MYVFVGWFGGMSYILVFSIVLFLCACFVVLVYLFVCLFGGVCCVLVVVLVVYCTRVLLLCHCVCLCVLFCVCWDVLFVKSFVSVLRRSCARLIDGLQFMFCLLLLSYVYACVLLLCRVACPFARFLF